MPLDRRSTKVKADEDRLEYKLSADNKVLNIYNLGKVYQPAKLKCMVANDVGVLVGQAYPSVRCLDQVSVTIKHLGGFLVTQRLFCGHKFVYHTHITSGNASIAPSPEVHTQFSTFNH